MKFSRVLLLSLFIAMNLNTTVQAGWSFSGFKQSIPNLFNTETFQQKIKDMFTSKWQYAAGLFLIPVCFGICATIKRCWTKKDKKDDIVNPKPRQHIPHIFKNDSESEEEQPQQPVSIAPALEPFIKTKPLEIKKLNSVISDPETPITLPSLETKQEVINLLNPKTESPLLLSPEQSQEIIEDTTQGPLTKSNSEEDLNNNNNLLPVNLEKSEDLFSSAISMPTLIQKGLSVFQQIQQGKLEAVTDKNVESRLADIVSLMHYFYALACEKNQQFKAGTFIIEDPKNTIFKVMFEYVIQIYGEEGLYTESPTPKTCSAYPRPSSHLEKYYLYTNKMKPQSGWLTTSYIKKPEYIHYGIDVTEHNSLPVEGMHHILFGRVDKDRTFIRMEDHGLQSTDFVGHSFGFINSLGRKVAPQYFGSDDGPDMRKERVPGDILYEFSKLFNFYTPEEKNALIKEAQALGISSMITTVEEKIKITSSAIWKQELQNFIVMIKSHKKEFDNLDTRIGSEVILTQIDFNKELN